MTLSCNTAQLWRINDIGFERTCCDVRRASLPLGPRGCPVTRLLRIPAASRDAHAPRSCLSPQCLCCTGRIHITSTDPSCPNITLRGGPPASPLRSRPWPIDAHPLCSASLSRHPIAPYTTRHGVATLSLAGIPDAQELYNKLRDAKSKTKELRMES